MLDKITNLLENGKNMNQIDENLSLPRGKTRKIIEEVKENNLEEYNRLRNLVVRNSHQNLIAHGRKNATSNLFSNNKLACIDGLINKRLTLEEAADNLHCSKYIMFTILKEYYEKNPSVKLKEIIDKYNENFTEYENKGLSFKNTNLQYELIMVALTYRVSIKNLCRLFKTNIKDIEMLFKNFSDLTMPLDYLKYETTNESKELSDLAFKNASHYFKRKNEILSLLHKVRTNKELDKINILEEKLKKLRSEIDDTNIKGIKEIKFLTEEEKESIVKYRLKYSLSKTRCKEIFGINKDVLTELENNLIENNLFYQEKISLLNDYYEQYKNEVGVIR